MEMTRLFEFFSSDVALRVHHTDSSHAAAKAELMETDRAAWKYGTSGCQIPTFDFLYIPCFEVGCIAAVGANKGYCSLSVLDTLTGVEMIVYPGAMYPCHIR